MLGLVKTQGNQAKVGELLARLPGAEELIAAHGGDGAGHGGGGLLCMLAGGMMGGPLAAISKLSGRHSVSIMRLSARAARLSASGVTLS